MESGIGILLFLLAGMGVIYFFVGRWAASECYDRGYPAWMGWLILVAAGPFLTWIIITFLPKKSSQPMGPEMYMATHAALAREQARGPQPVAGGGYHSVEPPMGWGPGPSLAEPWQPPQPSDARPAFGWSSEGGAATGSAESSWNSSGGLASGASHDVCLQCRQPIAAGAWVCPHCGAPRQ